MDDSGGDSGRKPLTDWQRAQTPRKVEYQNQRDTRPREVRSLVWYGKRMRETEDDFWNNASEYPEDPGPLRPRTRGECANGPRPCPWVGCRHHLYLDTTHAASIQLNFPDIEPHEMRTSCSLDVADAGGETLHDTGRLMNVVRERIRQLENSAVAKVKKALAEWEDEE